MLAVRYGRCRSRYAVCHGVLQQSQIGIGPCGSGLDQAQTGDESAGQGNTADVEVFYGPLRLRPVQRVGRDTYLTQAVFFGSKFSHDTLSLSGLLGDAIEHVSEHASGTVVFNFYQGVEPGLQLYFALFPVRVVNHGGQ